MDDIFRKELEAFRDSALPVLRFVSEEREKSANPPDQEILICLGNASAEAFREHTKNISSATAVIYIYPNVEHREKISFPDKKNTVFLSMGPKSFFPDKTGLFVALSKYRKISVSIESVFENTYANEIKTLNDAIRKALSNNAQSSAGRLVYLRNALKNLPFIIRDCGSGINFENDIKTAVVCSAGPSLKGQLDILRKNMSKLIVISVGRASKLLAESGIAPDFTIDIDPDVNWFDSGLLKDSIPVFSSSVRPNNFIKNIPAVWLYGDAFTFNKYLESSGIKLVSAVLSKTVTVTALDFARYLKCTDIALLGSDLCLNETGNYYTDSVLPENNSVIEVQSADKGKVLATKNLNALRQSIEEYICNSKAAYPEISFYNCTLRGAFIRGTSRINFGDFCLKNSDNKTKKFSLFKTENKDINVLNFGKINSKIDVLSEILGEMRDICFKILRELKGAKPSNDKVNRFKQRFAELSDKEINLKNDSSTIWLISPVYEQADEFAAEGMKYEKLSGSNNFYQIELLRRKYAFCSDIFSDISNDIKNISSQAVPFDYYERDFKTFRKAAISFIQKQNAEFAELLYVFNSKNEVDFNFIPNLQNFSIINIISGNEIYPLNPSEIDLMPDELDCFLKKNNFSEANDAVVFFAPGNWFHVKAMAEKYPSVKSAVIEIWPSVFSKIINSNMFFHAMPETFSIFCLCDELKQQEKSIVSFMDKMKKEKRRILFFNNPYTFKIPEVSEKFENFKKILNIN